MSMKLLCNYFFVSLFLLSSITVAQNEDGSGSVTRKKINPNRVKIACTNCRANRQPCDNGNPCQPCSDQNPPADCVRPARKKRTTFPKVNPETRQETETTIVEETQESSTTDRGKLCAACDECRESHIRCVKRDKGKKCAGCFRRDLSCVYTPRKKRGPKKRKNLEDIQVNEKRVTKKLKTTDETGEENAVSHGSDAIEILASVSGKMYWRTRSGNFGAVEFDALDSLD
jgi:hypothetical protein